MMDTAYSLGCWDFGLRGLRVLGVGVRVLSLGSRVWGVGLASGFKRSGAIAQG